MPEAGIHECSVAMPLTRWRRGRGEVFKGGRNLWWRAGGEAEGSVEEVLVRGAAVKGGSRMFWKWEKELLQHKKMRTGGICRSCHFSVACISFTVRNYSVGVHREAPLS